MRPGLVLATLLLPLSGCYVAQPAPSYGYAAPGYPPPGYPPQGYAQEGYGQPGYPPPQEPPPGYDGDPYPGYSYNGGAPTLFVDGAAVPLIVVGGAWGYYDARHYWHGAPEPVARNLQQRHAGYYPGGGGYPPQKPPNGGYPPQRPPNGGYPPQRPPDGGYAQPRPVASGGGYRGQPQTPPPPPQAAAQAQHEEHQRSHDCPPGQRC